MAKKYGSTSRIDGRKKRPGIHSKTKTSNRKDSKNYKKKYRRQGR